MPVISQGVGITGTPDVNEFEFGTFEAMGAAASSALENLPIAKINQSSFVRFLENGGLPTTGGVLGEENPFAPQRFPKAAHLSKEEVAAKAKESGVELPSIPEGGYREDTANFLIERRYKEKQNQLVLQNAPGTNIAQFGTSLAVGLLDPLNIASGFVPIVPEARYAAMLAGAGESFVARAGVRAAVGAVEGAAGAAMLEPINMMTSRELQDDYTATTVMSNLVFGAAMGSVLHVGGGTVSDKFFGGLESPNKVVSIGDQSLSTPRDPIYSRIEKMSHEAKGEMLRGAIAQDLDNKPVNQRAFIELEATKVEVLREQRLEHAKSLDPEAFQRIDELSPKLEELKTEVTNLSGEKNLGSIEPEQVKTRLEEIQTKLNSGELDADSWHRLAEEETDILSKVDVALKEVELDQKSIEHRIFNQKLEEIKADLAPFSQRAAQAYQRATVEINHLKPDWIGNVKDPVRKTNIERLQREVTASLHEEPNSNFIDKALDQDTANQLRDMPKEEISDPGYVHDSVAKTLDDQHKVAMEEAKRVADESGVELDIGDESIKKARLYEKAMQTLSNCILRTGL